ncbi:MAG: mechanosensitive ion channel family protein [Rickettsiales bacterium]|nr:mechanosensitive ion channel family protein [Rickettsiales bacterium]
MTDYIETIRESEIFSSLTFGGSAAWVSEVFIIVLATAFLSFFIERVLMRLHKRLRCTQTRVDDIFVEAIRKPAKTCLWFLGLTFATQVAMMQTETSLVQIIEPARSVAVIASLAWFLLRFIKLFEQIVIESSQKEEKSIDVTTVDAVAKLLRLTVMITTVLVVLQTLGFSISGILAFGGIGGIAVGFASKDLLANFFGGMMIYLDRPFTIGDWIRSPDRSIEGTVENIGWRQTRIRTFDKRPLYVPNSVFSTISVENPSRMTRRRIYEHIGVRYDDLNHLSTIIDQIKEMLIQHDDIDDSQTLIVNLNRFSDSSVDTMIYCFTHTTNWVKFHAIKQDVFLKISQIIADNGAEMAFPTSTLHIPDGVSISQSPEFAGLVPNEPTQKAS